MTTTTTRRSARREQTRRSAADAALTRVVNPAVRALLRSPLHDLLGDGVALLEYTGRRSGRRLAVPVTYLRKEGAVLLTSRGRRRWWRNFRASAPVTLTLQGRRQQGHAVVVDASAAERAAVLQALYARAGRDVSATRASALAADRVIVRVELDAVDEAAPLLRGWALWRRWTVAVTVGEALGFCVPAVAGAMLATLDAPFAVLVPVVLAAGVSEGTILGTAQAAALRRALPTVPSRRWITATAAGAVVAWTIGLVPFAVDLRDVPNGLLVAAGVPLGAVLLVAMGALQARELRGHVARPRRWIYATAGAWAVALMAFTAVTTPLWREGQATAMTAAIGVLGGIVMATTFATTSGAALVRLLRAR